MVAYTYLALGDSYTIGEQVMLAESFPYQLISQLRKADISVNNDNAHPHVFCAPEIVAKTGWTTGELIEAIGHTIFLPRYDVVTLLIGVNNQYRGLDVEIFKKEFAVLLESAIQFAGGVADNVYVLSIPDWGITPFAKERDANKIATEIDEYNKICADAAQLSKVHFIDITAAQRRDNDDQSFIAADGLHPSGKEYKKWAEQVAAAVLQHLELKIVP